jgi:uncharacterized protein YjiS (DUF1127 family)
MTRVTSAEETGNAYNSPGRPIAELHRAWRRRRQFRTALADLRRLDDRGLEDIGLRRETLEPAARFSVYGK